MPKSYFAAVLCLLFVGASIAAQPSAPKGGTDAISTPQLINYQGKLTDADGDPLTGTYDMAFAIYDVASGGSALWNETQTDVVVTEGIFNVILGSVTPVSGLPEGPDCYLGITVETDPEISPRTRLVSVPYATMAQDADDAANLGGVPAASYATQSWVTGQGYATQTWVAAGYSPLGHTHPYVQSVGAASPLQSSGGVTPSISISTAGAVSGQALYYNGSTVTWGNPTPGTHYHSASDITSGTLAIARGGTNNTSYTQGGVIYYNGSALASTAQGTSGQVLTSQGSGTPTWTTISASNYWTSSGSYIYPNTPSVNSNIQMWPANSGYGIYVANTYSPASNTYALFATNSNQYYPYGVYGSAYPYYNTRYGYGVFGYCQLASGGYGPTLYGVYGGASGGNSSYQTIAYGGYFTSNLSYNSRNYGVYGSSNEYSQSGSGSAGGYFLHNSTYYYGGGYISYGVYGGNTNSYSYGPMYGGYFYAYCPSVYSTGYPTYGVYGFAHNYYNSGPTYGAYVYGYSTSASYTNYVYGVYAYARSPSGATYTYPVYAYNASNTYYTTLGYSTYKAYGTGTASCYIVDENDMERTLHCPENPEVLFEDVGSNHLSNGYCRVNVDPLLLSGIVINATNPMRVFVTPAGTEPVSLSVVKGDTYFVVYGPAGSNIEFDWRLVANRKGFENMRFEAHERPADLKGKPTPTPVDLFPELQKTPYTQ